MHRGAYLGDLGTDEPYQVGGGDTQLQAAYAGANIYVVVLHALEWMYVGKRFFMPMGEHPPRMYPVVGSSSFMCSISTRLCPRPWLRP